MGGGGIRKGRSRLPDEFSRRRQMHRAGSHRPLSNHSIGRPIRQVKHLNERDYLAPQRADGDAAGIMPLRKIRVWFFRVITERFNCVCDGLIFDRAGICQT